MKPTFEEFLKAKEKRLGDLLEGLSLKEVAQFGYQPCSTSYKEISPTILKASSVDQRIALIAIKGLKLWSKEAIYINVEDHLTTLDKEDMVCKHILCTNLDHCQFMPTKPSSLTSSHSDQQVVPITYGVQLFTSKTKWQ